MSKTNLAIIIYVIGIIIGMFVLDIWSAETSPKAILGMIWTALFAIALYYAEKKENIIQIEKRLTGWQLESFKESYSYKIKNGMSLFKKKSIKE